MTSGTSRRGTASPLLEQVHRGDIWYVKLGSLEDSGLRKIMPCIIVQIDEMNQSGVVDTAVAVPLSNVVPDEEDLTEFDVVFTPEETGLPKKCTAVWTQLRAVAPSRMVNRTGQVEDPVKLDRLASHIATLVGMPARSYE